MCCVISKVKDVAEKAVEGQQEEFLKVEDEQQQKEIKKKDCPDPEDQKVLLQVCWLSTLSGVENQILKFIGNPRQKSVSPRKMVNKCCLLWPHFATVA